MIKPDGRVVMISGANRGIGLATAQHLASLGYTLSLGARDPASIPMGGFEDALTHRWEATEAATSEAWVAATMARYGRLDAVFLNAGVEVGGSLLTGKEEEFDMMFAVNFKGPLWLTRAALPPFIKETAT